MLHLITSGFSTEGHEELIKYIARDVYAKKRSILIVPEQQTLTAEKEMCNLLPPSAPLCFEATNFTRFTDTAFRTLGGIGGQYCTTAEEMLIMWRTLMELSGGDEEFSFATRRSINAALVGKALAAVKEMRSRGIEPEIIERTLEKGVKNPRLQRKLSDLFKIMGSYRSLLKAKYNDIGDSLAVLTKRLELDPSYLSGMNIYLEGFTSFTEGQYNILKVMMKSCDVTILLTLPEERRGEFVYKEVLECYNRLYATAKDCGVKIKNSHPNTDREDSQPIIQDICSLLWSASGEIDNEALHSVKEGGGRVRIFETENPFDECDLVASDIRRRVIEEGASYSDFAIIARSSEGYYGIIDTALMRSEIPHFISKRRDISNLEAIKLINTAYSIILYGFRREDVLSYSKCGLSGIRFNERDAFEIYVKMWDIDKDNFVRGEWNMSPDGYGKGHRNSEFVLSSINQTRKTLIEPLLAFSEEEKDCVTVKEHAQSLIKYLTNIKMERSLLYRATQLKEIGEIAAAEENAKLWRTICDCTQTLVNAVGELECSTEVFRNLLGIVISEASIGKIPAFLDSVTVGDADMIRISGKKHIYLIGVNKGEFPMSITDNSYFTEREKATLEKLDLPLKPDLLVKNAREMFCFSRAFSSASESVTLIYTRRNASFSPTSPSDVIDRIVGLGKGSIAVVKSEDIPHIDRVYSTSDALMMSGIVSAGERATLKEALTKAGVSTDIRICEGSSSNTEMKLGEEALELYYGEDILLSQSRLDQFARCPFAYYLNYNLGLEETKSAELNSAVIGSFVHSILENFFRELKGKKKNIELLSEQERDSLAERSAQDYIKKYLGDGYGDARVKNAIRRLCNACRPVIDGLCREFEGCRYEPAFVELKIDGSGEGGRSIVYHTEDGKRVVIDGTVDRVDTYTDKESGDVYVRVIDYKSGAKAFSPSDLEEGANLQMFLYLKSIVETDTPEFLARVGVEEGKKLIPAGVLYVKTSVKDTVVETPDKDGARTAVRNLSERMGMLLDDKASIGAMNPEFLPFVISDEPKHQKKRKEMTYSLDEWEEKSSMIERLILGEVARMREGEISAKPTQRKSDSTRPCNYCQYKKICRSAKE